MSQRSEIVWAPRVSLSKIRELYLKESQGICDDELIDDVGFRLYSRCDSILEYTEAHNGRVKCKRCAAAGKNTYILRTTHKPGEMLQCPACGWQVRWRVYVAESEKLDGQLHGSNALAAFQHYVEWFPSCSTREEKILAIDQLIHEFHWILVAGKELEPHKPAGVNLLRGTTTEVLELLNQLTYGKNAIPGLISERDWWRSQKPVVKKTKT